MNADLLMQQATYYFSMGQTDLASNVLSHAERFAATGIANQRLSELRRYIPVSAPSRDEWKIRRHWYFLIQLVPLALVLSVVIVTGLSLNIAKHPTAVVAERRASGAVVIDARGVMVIDARGPNGK